MAGTIQALPFTGFPATASTFRLRNPHLLSVDVKFRGISIASRSLTRNDRNSRFLPVTVKACQRSDQIDGNGSNPTNLSALTKGLSWAQPILRFAGNNFLPLVLITGVTLGLVYPSLGCLADKYSVSKLGPFGIFIISGLMLRSKEVGAAVEAWPVGLIGLVPWIQVSRSRSLLLMVKPRVFLVAIGLGTLLHLSLLLFNTIVVRSVSAVTGGSKSVFSKEENAIAFTLVASQKTLPVMVAVIEPLGGALGESGLLVLPCVAAHLYQIIIDSFLINFWRPKGNPNSIKGAK